jgi:hypothetical protein
MNKRQLQTFAWLVSSAAVATAVVAWGHVYDWQLQGLSIYQLFPLFGLMAFSLMWAHYIASVARQHFGLEKDVLTDYFELTSGMVLVLILAHPGLLAWQRWRDGFGLPPGSEIDYLGPLMRSSIILGMVALTAFLAYEFRRVFMTKKWWRYVEFATDTAMVLIYIHALRLGGQLQTGWFRGVWVFYGVTLGGSLAYIYYRKITRIHPLSL